MAKVIGKPKSGEGKGNSYSPRVASAARKLGELMTTKIQKPVKNSGRGR